MNAERGVLRNIPTVAAPAIVARQLAASGLTGWDHGSICVGWVQAACPRLKSELFGRGSVRRQVLFSRRSLSE